MHLRLTLDPDDTLVVHLREGPEETSVPVRPSSAGIRSLTRAVDTAIADGYGECFWPAMPIGQTWWMFRRDAETIEVVAMWTRGGAALWEHVFRATDSVEWLRDQLRKEIDGLAG